MASIEQAPGELNIGKIIKGDDFAWTASFAGDATADTFYAVMDNGAAADVVIAVGKAYSGVTLKTTLTFTLTAAQTATLTPSTLPWYCTQTSSGAVRTLLAGTIGVYNRWT